LELHLKSTKHVFALRADTDLAPRWGSHDNDELRH
jgi:hypothetical protein